MITLEITKEHAKSLFVSLQFVENEGPLGQGWASDDIEEFVAILRAAIESQG